MNFSNTELAELLWALEQWSWAHREGGALEHDRFFNTERVGNLFDRLYEEAVSRGIPCYDAFTVAELKDKYPFIP